MAEMKLIPFTVESIEEKAVELPYGVQQLQAPSLWALGETGKNVVVAVIDTGIESNHPFLKDNIIESKSFVDSEENRDYNGHGTHVAGIIKSMAPDVLLLPIKVLNRVGSGDYSDIIRGIEFATAWEGKNGEKVRIINMSLGGSDNIPALENAILNAAAQGILVVVASGNEGTDSENYEIGYPSNYNECITVTANDENKQLASFSNKHLQVDVIAPGVRVHSSYINGTYAKLSGTSMATPHIAGALALLIPLKEREFKRTLTESELYSHLVKCCCSLGLPKSSEGNGLPELGETFKQCEVSE